MELDSNTNLTFYFTHKAVLFLTAMIRQGVLHFTSSLSGFYFFLSEYLKTSEKWFVSEKKTRALDGLLQRVWWKSDAINRNLEKQSRNHFRKSNLTKVQLQKWSWSWQKYKIQIDTNNRISIPINLGGDGAFVREKDRGENEGKDRGWANSNFIISKCSEFIFLNLCSNS